jgi:outer membrane protein TolC
MESVRFRPLPRLSGLRRLAVRCCLAGWPALTLGCTQLPALPAEDPSPAVVRGAGETGPTVPVRNLPAAETLTIPPRSDPVPDAHQPVPVSLDTVLRLAQGQNLQVGVAREKVREAFADKDLAAKRWLPDIYLGTSYYRHEGGIQDVDGTVFHSSFGSLFGGMEVDTQFDIRDYAFKKVDAQRKIWQQRGELSRVTSETLLDAANTYIDLLAAYQGEAIIRSTDPDVDKLLQRATDLTSSIPAAQAQVEAVRSEIAGRRQMALRFLEQAAEAKAKLAYDLGMNPECDLLPVDNRLVALQLVDASPPVCELVAQALANGPGVREMEGLLNLVNQSMARSQGMGQFMPVFGVRMAEGLFGAGPGSRSDWDNRWDLGLQVRWNITEWTTARERKRVAQAKLNQLHLSYQDLRAKLAMGVQASREGIHGGLKQLRQAEEQIKHARKTLQLSQERLYNLPAERQQPDQVLLAIETLMRAQLGYLSVLRDYDKAQLRLMVLLGQGTAPCSP